MEITPEHLFDGIPWFFLMFACCGEKGEVGGVSEPQTSGTPVLRYSGNGLVQLTTTQSTPLRQPARTALFYYKDRREERENLIVVLSVPSLFFPTFLLEVVSLRYSLVLWLS